MSTITAPTISSVTDLLHREVTWDTAHGTCLIEYTGSGDVVINLSEQWGYKHMGLQNTLAKT